MTTTCQEIYVRAKRFALANNELAPVRHEWLSRINADQHALFAELAAVTRDRFQTAVAIVSSSGASAREFDLSAVSPAVLRVLKLVLAAGSAEVNQVDILDTDAEFAPRYTVRGQKLIEVSNDWSSSSGTVSATLTYVYGATTIDATGLSTQVITVPDEWADLLVLPLALYFSGQRDSLPNTSQQEYDRLTGMLKSRRDSFLEYVKNFGGVEARRFMLPQPPDIKKQ